MNAPVCIPHLLHGALSLPLFMKVVGSRQGFIDIFSCQKVLYIIWRSKHFFNVLTVGLPLQLKFLTHYNNLRTSVIFPASCNIFLNYSEVFIY
jgi:hypothetical protein